MKTLEFEGSTIALIVRGKNNHVHAPSVMDQHADVILPDGSPMGFFGENHPYSSGRSERYDSSSAIKGSLKSRVNRRGIIFDYNAFNVHRPFYVDLEMARGKYRLVSTVLVVDVSKSEALLFTNYWKRLQTNPVVFHLVGHNCSTRASQGFRHAGITRCDIPGLDTPNNLYRQIIAIRRRSTRVYCGYLGFKPRSGGGFDVLIDELPSD